MFKNPGLGKKKKRILLCQSQHQSGALRTGCCLVSRVPAMIQKTVQKCAVGILLHQARGVEGICFETNSGSPHAVAICFMGPNLSPSMMCHSTPLARRERKIGS